MGLVYDVIFNRGDVSESHGAADDHAAQPEWVLDHRDGGTLVWRRYDRDVRPARRRRVEFLDAVQVHVFERDDYGGGGGGGRFDNDYDDYDDYDGYGDCDGDGGKDADYSKALFYRDDRHDGPVLIVVSVTVLGLCVGLAFLFAPVRWLFHQLLVG
ncbi:Hypothetical protein CINCED_3A003837 [Cinara cedri]|uniref:Uncharacterized protein n=1 Tax=Cinara cedri TaxID=506608 RepID=A0A5E4MQL2_9HEMI|nr:Hypothetical protein CINCED_3A003837 [Cinara cedri]